MRDRQFAIPDQRRNQQARARISQSREEEAEQLFDIRARDIERRSQRGTNDRESDDAGPGQHSRTHHHRNDVENPQRRFVSDVPVGCGNKHNEPSDPREDSHSSAFEYRTYHLFHNNNPKESPKAATRQICLSKEMTVLCLLRGLLQRRSLRDNQLCPIYKLKVPYL